MRGSDAAGRDLSTAAGPQGEEAAGLAGEG